MENRTKSAPAKDIDEYLASVPLDMRAALEKLRRAIKAAAPDATEVISYQIPTFRLHGPLVAFGAAAKHCGFYVMSAAVMETYKDELKPYSKAKTTVRFTPDKPLPDDLVKKLVLARVAETEAARR